MIEDFDEEFFASFFFGGVKARAYCGVKFTVQQGFSVSLNGGERGAQFVRDVRHEI